MNEVQYIVLLRGINVGGNNIISMIDLKEKLVNDGFHNVRSYINSGNILLSSLINDKEIIKSEIERLILNEFKLKITACVITVKELQKIKQACPSWWNIDSDSRHNVLFVIPPMTGEMIMNEIGVLNNEFEQCVALNQVIFWSVKNNFYSKSKYAKIIGKSYYSYLTIRNANTFNKLIELSQN